MAELKERFNDLAERLFSRFSSVAAVADFSNPAELDPISGAEVVAGETTGPIEVQRPRLTAQARAALGIETREFFIVVLQRDVLGFAIQAEHTSATIDGVEYEVRNVSQDAAGATFRVRCAGGA